MRLRILQVAACPFPSPQGSQVYIQGMARALARRGHEVTVACYPHGLGPPDPSLQVARIPSIVPGYRRLRAGPDLAKPLLDVALAARVAGLEADVLHAHGHEAALAAAVASAWSGLPVVYSAHTAMGEELHTYFQGRLARTLARGVGRLLDRSVPRLAGQAIALSPAGEAHLRQAGCRSIRLLPPGIDPADLAPVPPASLPPGPWVIYTGNPDGYQDLEVLARAMARVPEAGLLFVSASPPPASWRGRLPRLRVVQTADFGEVRALLAAADIAALPRAVCSGFPIKLLNYLGAGLPTVAARGAAAPMPGMVVVPDHDPGAMAQAIRALLRAPEERRALGEAGRAHVLATCSWRARAQALEAIYIEMLSEQSAHGIVRPGAAGGRAWQR